MSQRIAEQRLAATTRHLAGSSSSSSSKPSSTSTTLSSHEINNVIVFGAGSMGAGIAQVSLVAGCKVTLCDIEQRFLDAGKKTIIKSLSKRAKQKIEGEEGQKAWVEGILSGLTLSTDAEGSVKSADIVIEAIIERVDIKQSLFSKLDKAAKASCIFVSNTSSLSVTEIGETVSAERKSRFGGLHFFNPVPQMKLVEVVRISTTSDETFNALFAFSKKIGKVPVACKDTPGFIVNRLLIPYMREAISLLERGDATARDIDTAMKLGAGHPMGPMELADLVGLDINAAIGEAWKKRAEAGDERIPESFLKPSPLVEKLVKGGKLGVKTGEGFYKYK